MNIRLLLIFFLLAFQASAQIIPSYISQNGLVGYWPFNGNSNDESGNGNNGIVYPNTTLTQDRFNNSNNAYLFDNSVQSGIQTNTPLTYTITGISGSLWFNTNVFLNSSAGHRQFISGTSSIPFQFAYNNGGVDLEVYNQSGGLTVFTWPSIFTPNSWHHVAFSVNTNGNVLISIDGQVYNAGSSPNSLRTANNSSYIFGLSSSSFWPNPFSGKLDDIAIWNRGLSQQEILQLYSGISCVPPTASIIAGGPTSFCSGANVLLSAPSDTSYTYQWQLNGSAINSATSATYSANASGDYSVIISNGASCSDTSAVISVTAFPTVTLTSLPSFVNIQTPSVALNGSPSGGSYSGQGISGTNFIPSIAGLGHAVVSYSYTSTAGCSGNIVKNTIVYDTTGTFCTSYDTIYTSINDTVLVSVQDTLIIETLILGSNPIQSNEIKVYPNPAHSFLEIDNGNFALMGGYTIRIENSLGQVVFNQAVNQQLFSINLSTWTGDGVYYLHIINSNGITQEIKKIVLQ